MTALGPSRLDRPSHGLWSLWEMMNFRFSAAHFLLGQIAILITVSSHNMEFVESAGRFSERVKNDPTNEPAMEECCRDAAGAAERARVLFASLHCAHIDIAAQQLARWAQREDHEPTWAELNTRARALRDAIDTELR